MHKKELIEYTPDIWSQISHTEPLHRVWVPRVGYITIKAITLPLVHITFLKNSCTKVQVSCWSQICLSSCMIDLAHCKIKLHLHLDTHIIIHYTWEWMVEQVWLILLSNNNYCWSSRLTTNKWIQETSQWLTGEARITALFIHKQTKKMPVDETTWDPQSILWCFKIYMCNG